MLCMYSERNKKSKTGIFCSNLWNIVSHNANLNANQSRESSYGVRFGCLNNVYRGKLSYFSFIHKYTLQLVGLCENFTIVLNNLCQFELFACKNSGHLNEIMFVVQYRPHYTEAKKRTNMISVERNLKGLQLCDALTLSDFLLLPFSNLTKT